MAGHHQALKQRVLLPGSPDQLIPVTVLKIDVDDDNIRIDSSNQRHPLFTATGCSTKLNSGVLINCQLKPLEQTYVIVNQHNPERNSPALLFTGQSLSTIVWKTRLQTDQ